MEGTDEYYRKTAEETRAIIEGYYNDQSGWENKKTTKEVVVDFKQSPCPGFGGHLYRGKCDYNCSKETLFEYVDPLPPPAPRLRWDKGIKGVEVLKKIDDNLRINWTATNSAAMGLISPRDFVDLVLTVQGDNALSTCGVSFDYPECPPKDNYVRGWNHHCSLICIDHPERPQHSRLISFIQPDIRGKVPRSIVESAIPGSMVDFFSNLRDCLKGDKKLTD